MPFYALFFAQKRLSPLYTTLLITLARSVCTGCSVSATALRAPCLSIYFPILTHTRTAQSVHLLGSSQQTADRFDTKVFASIFSAIFCAFLITRLVRSYLTFSTFSVSLLSDFF